MTEREFWPGSFRQTNVSDPQRRSGKKFVGGHTPLANLEEITTLVEQSLEDSQRALRNYTDGRMGNAMMTRSQTAQGHAFPLVQGNGGVRYKPLNIEHVKALADQMPPVSEGGAMWLRQLDKLTTGQQLSSGDFRAVAARCMIMKLKMRQENEKDELKELEKQLLKLQLGAVRQKVNYKKKGL